MARFASWQLGSNAAQHFPHHRLGFTYRQSPVRKTGKRQVAHKARALLPEFRVKSPLHNAKKCLLRAILFLDEKCPFSPAVSPLHGFLCLAARAGISSANVEWQDDICSQFSFDAHDTLWCQYL